jgi:hypothetical protein
VTREDFRRELGDAFDSISGPPSPALPDRVRSALVEAPERRGPVWIAALAAAVIAVMLVGVLLVTNPLNRPLGSGGNGTSTPSSSPNPTANPSPTASPVYDCTGSWAFIKQQAVPPLALIDAVRIGTHAGYDRLTIEFKAGQPGSIQVRPQTGTTFVTDPKGDQVKLAGQDGIMVVIQSADSHTAYNGSTDIKTGFGDLLEVRKIGEFEGAVLWAMGLSKPACFHADMLSNPTRLVIDIQTS